MALKIPSPFPISAPPILNPTTQTHHRPPSELRFARWNNANAEKFNEQRRAQKEIEDDIRRERRFDSASRIARYYDSAAPSGSDRSFKSAGTPSYPSRPSIPGRKSKYSRNPHYPNPNLTPSEPHHPAFRQFRRTKVSKLAGDEPRPPTNRNNGSIKIADDGVSYVIDGAPFEFKYSYTETPKAKPLELREAPYAPFGPGTMPRPWTGRAPLPASKKKLREFDSFRLPPPHRKGVKPVQAPGPYLPGSGPKYVKSREEILGEPLTKEEIKELVEACKRTKRQLNMGRDGLTHNMLDNIHAHWKRRRVCKIKCKGVCTVDMENVREQLEERTGGKIIYKTGGVLYLFRGRNYNYRTRPRFPLMLWRPITPVYPRLVKRVPEGTTLEEVTEMRKKGHKLIPICKLGKNGVYHNLVNHVREAFEECELARIDCQGMNGSDYRKIGGKLRDLVPCVLLSFAYEHILMWRGPDWKSTLPKLDTNPEETNESSAENEASADPSLQGEEETTSRIEADNESPELLGSSSETSEDLLSSEDVEPLLSTSEAPNSTVEPETSPDVQSPLDGTMVSGNSVYAIETDTSGFDMDSVDEPSEETLGGSIATFPLIENTGTTPDVIEEDLSSNEDQQVTSEVISNEDQQVTSEAFATPNTKCTEGVLALLLQAFESGSAIVLDDADLDPDVVYRKMVTFSRSTPPEPVFRYRLRRVWVETPEVQEKDELDILDLEPQLVTTSPSKSRRGEKKSYKPKTSRRKDFGELVLDNVVPQGSLRVDELAKLLG